MVSYFVLSLSSLLAMFVMLFHVAFKYSIFSSSFSVRGAHIYIVCLL